MRKDLRQSDVYKILTIHRTVRSQDHGEYKVV